MLHLHQKDTILQRILNNLSMLSQLSLCYTFRQHKSHNPQAHRASTLPCLHRRDTLQQGMLCTSRFRQMQRNTQRRIPYTYSRL
jgi:hypothetical protein